MKKLVAELEGAELDYWVAQTDPHCVGLHFEWREDHYVGLGNIGLGDAICCFIPGTDMSITRQLLLRKQYEYSDTYMPSRDWRDVGRLIEENDIAMGPTKDDRWLSAIAASQVIAFGDKPRMAAMRAYVMSKHGEQVEIDDQK
ncbi:MAG: phage protein NinX family protein [Methylobacter sp.]